ncbi:MAG: NirA family protein [Alphaproteobacteria bacterium]|nr:MAG: NirA family protein [Alphaproteobacteria bacterium]
MSAQDFTEEQRRYLEGFVSGVQARRAAQGLKPLGTEGGGAAQPAGPDKEHLAAMARFEAAGRKLSPEEKAKRDEHPFDAYGRLRDESAKGLFPKGIDNFRWRFHGLFYLAPTQNAYMCRLRIPNGILTHWQLAGIADLAQAHGGGYAHVTTRANLQIRDVLPHGAIPLIEGLAGLGIPTKGTGADNIRNVTGSPTAGIDPQELIDTRPYAKAWHHHILNDRSLYGLPRKFNVGFDGGGVVPVLEDTNDIAFTAVTVGEGAGVDTGVWFRLGVGGITGHQDFAKLGGVYVRPEEAVAVADAIVRVFIANGDRTDRKKARLKYVLDAWGLDKFLADVEAKLGTKLVRLADDRVSAPNRQNRQAHIGFHAQRQPGKVWAGVALPVGKSTAEQMRGLARIARELGDGDIRLTVWQNLLISGIAENNAALVEQCLGEIGLTAKATSVRAGLIACTGNTGCKFALSNTKGTAMAIADWVEPRVALDTPVNIHLTGCPHSCAQHYIGDIGLLACRVAIDDAGEDTVEGFHLFVGGGFGADAGIGRELCRDVKAEDCPRLIERILQAYVRHRAGPAETFLAFTRRHEVPALKAMVEAIAGGGAA